VALDLRARIHPAHNPRVTPVVEVLSPSFKTYVGDFGSAAATKRVSRRDDGALFKWKKNALLAGKRPGHTNPLHRTGGAAALVLRARLNPEAIPQMSCARHILSPSFRARVGTFGSAAATKCVSRRDDLLTRFRV